MRPEVLSIIAIFVSPLLVLAIQAVLFRVSQVSSQLLTIVAMLLGYPCFFLLLNYLPHQLQADLAFYLYFFLLYSFAAYSYFHIFNMSETSRRVKLLQSMASGQAASLEQMAAIYNEQEMAQVRLARLIALGQICETEERYYSRGRLFLFTAKITYTLACLLNCPWPALQKFRAHPLKRD